jgi:arsenite methyltransferase
MATEPTTDIREHVRDKYAAAARGAAAGASCGCGDADATSCCAPADLSVMDASGTQVFGDALNNAEEAAGAPAAAVQASLGCGVPTAVADLHPGETVLDLAPVPARTSLSPHAASPRRAGRSAST